MFKADLITDRSRPLQSAPTALLILTMIGVPAGLARQPPVARPLPVPGATQKATAGAATQLFERNNLIAWCIVPFDSKKRGPEERAVMLQKLGFKHFAYDWRTEHISTFDAEVEALDRHGIGLDAFWVAPGELNRESRIILDLLKRHGIKAQLWVLLDLGNDRSQGAEQERRVKAAAESCAPWPKRRARSAARWLSTTTAAGLASPRIRSPSSSGSRVRELRIWASSTTSITGTTTWIVSPKFSPS